VRRREWGLLVVHVGQHPSAAAHRDEFERFRDLLLDDVRPRVALLTYEQVLPVLEAYGLSDLAADVQRRIAAAMA
jgi:hypothetical protein